MNKYEKILLLRYSDFHGVDTIQEHANVIKEEGRCWWVKIGKQPSKKYISEIRKQSTPHCLLYTPGVLHLCRLGKILEERPLNNYPMYYKDDIFGKENEPHIYFELLSIEKLDMLFLEDYIVSSSEKEVLYDLKKTISSYMFIQHKDAPRKPKPIKKEQALKRKVVIDKHGCIYKTDGTCTNRRCVNYQYECVHPDICIKQKIK